MGNFVTDLLKDNALSIVIFSVVFITAAVLLKFGKITLAEMKASGDGRKITLGGFLTCLVEKLVSLLPRYRRPVWTHFAQIIKARNKDARYNSADLLVHTFWGFDKDPIRDTVVNHSSVYHLWADSDSGSWIKVQTVRTRNDDRVYRIEFYNGGDLPSNVTIRPCAHNPLRRDPEQKYLCFEARLPRGARGEIALSFRVVDKFGTHWTWAGVDDPSAYEIWTIQGNTWKWIAINLDGGFGKWKVFQGDGNKLYWAEPNFSDMILGLVIELGSDQGIRKRPGAGEGQIEVRNIELRTEVPGRRTAA